MKIIKKQIPESLLKKITENNFGDFVKAVVDIEKEIMVIDAELHADEEALPLEKGSKQADLWGINLYPEIKNDDWIEFDSMINIRPASGNLSRSIDNSKIRKKIIKIVNNLIKK